jgi:transglutaminase-like putative cysteine protease
MPWTTLSSALFLPFGHPTQVPEFKKVLMIFYISHSLNYSYSRPVFLEPLTVRLRPRCDSVQQVIQFKLDVVPAPDGISEYIDQESNNAATLWFSGQHGTLSISAKSEVEVLPVNPFNFIVTENNLLKLPVIYPQSCRYELQPYLSRRCESSQIDDFIQPVIKETNGETIPFLVRLASQIREQFDRVVRETGAPMAPEETIAGRKGACRDLALLFMESCRAVGLAARFVSGYRWSEESIEKHRMHAWAEVYISGGGWRGFDPSTGRAVADRHIAVATAANPLNAAPIDGTFRGTGVYSKLEYDISISLSQEISNQA